MNDEFSFLNTLNSEQREVCNDLTNYLITACPGSGKTRTLIYRLAFFQKKYPDSQKYNIAITYTNRAAIEIDNRLNEMGIDLSSIWTGTIHQFCMNFIIRPYAMYSNDLKKGYHVIDEYVQKRYCLEIAKELGIDVGFKNPLEFDSINKLYHQRLKDNKEIDFDMILEISKYLVTNYQFISENISCLFRSIHVDEYQDTNQFQYDILGAIFKTNKKINLFFVGDPNQAIYNNLGGIPKKCSELEELFGVKFCEKELNGCYRSTQRIVEYYSNFENIKSNVYSKSSNRDDRGKILYNYKIDVSRLPEEFASIILERINNGIEEKDICIVAPQWYQIYPLANKLRKYLPDIKFDAPDISPFKFDPINPFYILAKLLFTPSGRNIQMRKKYALEFMKILSTEYQVNFRKNIDAFSFLKIVNSVPKKIDGMEYFKNGVEIIINKLGLNFSDEEDLLKVYSAFLERTFERINNYNLFTDYVSMCNYFKEKEGVVINTIHGIKGEEYDTVIAFDLLNGHLPHWDYIYKDSKKEFRLYETNNLLYVLCSRAKVNLYLYSEIGRKTQSGNKYTPTDELYFLKYDYD